MIVDHGGKQVVRGADGVEIPRKVQVDIFHRNDLRISAARSASLDAEYRSEGRLAQGNRYFFADSGKPVGKTDGRGGLAFSCGGWRNGGYEDQLSGFLFGGIQIGQVNLRFVVSVLLHKFRRNTRALRNFGNVLRAAGLGNLDIR